MTHPSKSPKYAPEVRERAVRMVFDHAGDYPSQRAAKLDPVVAIRG
ncbi:MAG: hypothetical protein NW217_16550 [Hyphomicrobiaceae bacterium]|nr:hypothetical protein [Hyphomicrobiaceae bacterium]